MDHIHLPSGATLDEFDYVPYVSNEAYDGGPSLTYPHRHDTGIIEKVLQNGQFRIDLGKESSAERIAKAEAVVQHWPFYGLMCEVLSPIVCLLLDFKKQVVVGGETRTVIDTSIFVEFLESLKTEWSEHNDEVKERMVRRVQECLEVTGRIVDEHFGNVINPNILISISTLCEAIQSLMRKVKNIAGGYPINELGSGQKQNC